MIFGSGPRTTRARSSPLIGQFPGAWLIIVIEIKHLAPLNAINYIGRWHNGIVQEAGRHLRSMRAWELR